MASERGVKKIERVFLSLCVCLYETRKVTNAHTGSHLPLPFIGQLDP